MRRDEHGATFAVIDPGPDDDRAWDRLARDVVAVPFVRPGWVRAWAEAFERPMRLATVERSGELVAALPIVASGSSMRTAADWHVPSTEIAAVDSAAAVTLLRGLGHTFPRISLDFVLEGSLTELIGSVVLESRPHRRVIRQQSPYVDTTPGWDAYLASLSTKKMRELRRRRRRLAEDLGEVRYEVVDGAGEWQEALAVGMIIEGSGWKGDEGTAVASDPATERCYREVARWAASVKLLELGMLRAGDRVVAFDYSLSDGARVWLLKTGFDADLASFAPGQLLRHDAIRSTFERGLDSYEFTGEAEPWKDEWTTARRPVVLVDAFPPGPTGRVRLFGARAGRALRVRLGRAAWRS